jgi:hypothetical protein
MRELEKIKRERLEQKEKEVGSIRLRGFLPYSPISRNANVLQRKRSNESTTLPRATRCSTPKTSISSGDGTTTLSSRIKLAGPKRNGARSLSTICCAPISTGDSCPSMSGRLALLQILDKLGARFHLFSYTQRYLRVHFDLKRSPQGR